MMRPVPSVNCKTPKDFLPFLLFFGSFSYFSHYTVESGSCSNRLGVTIDWNKEEKATEKKNGKSEKTQTTWMSENFLINANSDCDLILPFPKRTRRKKKKIDEKNKIHNSSAFLAQQPICSNILIHSFYLFLLFLRSIVRLLFFIHFLRTFHSFKSNINFSKTCKQTAIEEVEE